MPWFAAAQAPQQTCARGTDHPPFIGEETEVQKGHVTPLGSRSMGGGARLGLGTASAPPTDQVQSSLPSFTLLHPLTQTLPGSHYLTLKTHFPSWNLSSWEVMLPGPKLLSKSCSERLVLGEVTSEVPSWRCESDGGKDSVPCTQSWGGSA